MAVKDKDADSSAGKEEPIEIVELGDDGKTVDKDLEQHASSEDQTQNESDDADDEESREQGEDSRLAGNADDEESESESKKQRNRRNELRKKAKQRDKLEINFLLQRNAELEKRVNAVEARTTQSEVNSVDSQIGTLRNQLAVAEDVMAGAVKSQNGEDMVKTMKIRDEIRDNLAQLEYYKQSANRQATQVQRPAVDNTVARNAATFTSRVSWYDPTGIDEDSQAIQGIEAQMVARGSDPRTAAHWQNLETRVKKLFAHRFEGDEGSDQDEQPAKRMNGGPRMPTNGQSRGGNKNVFHISQDRKKALIEAGVWDDPVLRDRYVKRYAQYDREAATSQRSKSNG